MGSTLLRVGDEAPDFQLEDAGGGTVHLRGLCQRGPVIVLFLRSPG